MNLLVLVVDDERDVEVLFRQQFRRELRSGQFIMEFALNGESALERINSADDVNLILILSDINMPGMNGLDLLQRAKEVRPEVPVVMITAYGDNETERNARAGGAEGFLTKPIDFSKLRAEIQVRLDTAA
jgi:CheY-like chemotaxis protein